MRAHGRTGLANGEQRIARVRQFSELLTSPQVPATTRAGPCRGIRLPAHQHRPATGGRGGAERANRWIHQRMLDRGFGTCTSSAFPTTPAESSPAQRCTADSWRTTPRFASPIWSNCSTMWPSSAPSTNGARDEHPDRFTRFTATPTPMSSCCYPTSSTDEPTRRWSRTFSPTSSGRVTTGGCGSPSSLRHRPHHQASGGIRQ